MNARRAACATILLVAATATACSGGTDSKTPTASAKPAKPAKSTSTSPAAKADTGPLKLGTRHHWSDTDVDGSHVSGTTTAVSYKQPAKVNLPDDVADFPNPVWATLEVKVCADASSSNVMTSQGPWSLGFPDDTRIEAPRMSGGGVPKPEYPTDSTVVQPGTCLRGLITFTVKKGTRPDRIIYGPEGRDPVIWTAPKA